MHTSRFNTKIAAPCRNFILGLILLLPFFSSAQEKKEVEILQAGALVQSPHIANAQRLLNDVIIKHQDVLMYCDSAYTYEGSNRVDAFGHVHINQGDTLHLYAQKVFYDGDRSFAQAIHDVELHNKDIILYTDTLDYDMENDIGYYDCFGKIVDSTNTLTSKVGKYYMNDKIAHFTDSVIGFSDKYTIDSDNIKYNTESEIIYFEGPTTIRDSANTLYAEDGWYNTITGEADLKESPEVYNETQLLKAKQIIYNKENGDGFAYGNVLLEDYENRTIVRGNSVQYNELTELATVTDSAMFISYNETDSLFLHADTLRTMPDTVEGENIVKAYYGVRFYRSDVQGICDSLIYFTKDSLVQLFRNPVLWSEMQQLSAERIEMIQHTNAPDQILMYKNSFIIAEQDSGMFDQIKGKDMVGYVINGELNNINVDGNGQTLYYAREDKEIIGMNRAESSNISIRFKDGQIHKIAFMKQPTGELKPLLDLTENDRKLSDFKWQIDLRPVSKDDIFREPKTQTPEITEAAEK
ncbi:OstA-like protein [Maribellus sediminis]|uniref:OstA-like protein n=1 Tax=Maribellus sediminis TaxID=2696285 RepID=UPI001431DC25|nr:OstA-like protein [Maribellus sediminis]